MTSEQFNSLNASVQEHLVLQQGNFLALRQEPEFIIRLYQLDSFYVELFYHQVRQHPVCIKSFINTDKLNLYLNGIDLGFLNY